MDIYENNIPEENTQAAPNPEVTAEPVNAYTQPPQARKRSPYEDSPYEAYTAPQRNPAPKKPKKVGNKNFWKGALCAVLALALLVGACATTAVVVNEYWETRLDRLEDSFEGRLEDLQKQINNRAPISGGIISAATEGLTPSQVYAMNVNAVLMIYNQITSQAGTATATGSGFVLTQDGYVVTNYHVVEGNGKLSVQTYDGKVYEAKLIGYDSPNDVALLKVEATGLQPVILGSSNDLIVGDQVVAIGNPLGELTSTLTVGYISAKERDVTTDGFAINMLQTDAAINSGNSGGPLFNMKGEVIGITTAKYSGTSSSGATIEGVGFAIPIDDVSGLLSDLATYGYVTGAYLGVSVSDVNASAAAYFGMPGGARVELVEAGSAANRAGVQVKDIIVALGEHKVGSVNDLTKALRNFKAGDVTVITVYRSGAEQKLTITLDEKPIQTTAQPEEIKPEEIKPEQQLPENGSFEDWLEIFKDFLEKSYKGGE